SERRSAAARGEVVARTVEILDAAADLLVCGAARTRQTALHAADRRLDALRVLALTPLALADVVAPLPDAAVRWRTAGSAAARLADLARIPAPSADRV